MDFWQQKRGIIPNENGKVYKLFGNIVTKDEYYYMLHALIVEYAYASNRLAVKVLNGFLQTMQDYTLNPHEKIPLAYNSLQIDSDFCISARAKAAYLASADAPEDKRKEMHQDAVAAKLSLHNDYFGRNSSDPYFNDAEDERYYAQEIPLE